MSNALKVSTLKDPVEILSNYVSKETGIQLTEKHIPMVLNRITKRMNDLHLETPSDYLNYFLKNEEKEKDHLISLLTTHHTYFFREFSQFEFLGNGALDTICKAARLRGDSKIKVWSAACSQGQEVFSLAMYLDFHLKTIDPTMKYEILGTDVDKKSVEMAINSVYPKKDLNSVPLSYLGNHWAKGTGDISSFVKAKQSLKSNIKFETLNLQETHKFPKDFFDIIFCRNVFIYFNRKQIEDITKAFSNKLSSEGLLFLGISESIYGLDLSLAPSGPSIYGRIKPKAEATKNPTVPLKTNDDHRLKSPQSETQMQLRVLCVDDSPVIHSLMKKIFNKENGFEIIGHAMNGLEAKSKIKELKPDVVTLDIHMPEQDGISYLKENFNVNHPPVIMVTSVSREDSELATEALKCGASDFVEKPTLANLTKVGEEIRSKLKMAFKSKNSSAKNLAFDKELSNKVTISHLNEMRRVFIFNPNEKIKLTQFLSMEEKNEAPPLFLVVDLPYLELKKFSELLLNETKIKFTIPDHKKLEIKKGDKFLLSSKDDLNALKEFTINKSTSYLIAGIPNDNLTKLLLEQKKSQFIIDESIKLKLPSNLSALANDSLPVTSFAYVSNLYFSSSHK